MDDERLPKRRFYRDVVTGFRRQGDQDRLNKETLETFLKLLQMNPANLDENSEDRRSELRSQLHPHRKRKREALQSQLRPLNVNAQPPLTCPRCQRTSRAPTGLVGYLRTNCNTRGYTSFSVLVQLGLILRADD
nr:unnamed protein product [Spirometra erinaceieuropaei]